MCFERLSPGEMYLEGLNPEGMFFERLSPGEMYLERLGPEGMCFDGVRLEGLAG